MGEMMIWIFRRTGGHPKKSQQFRATSGTAEIEVVAAGNFGRERLAIEDVWPLYLERRRRIELHRVREKESAPGEAHQHLGVQRQRLLQVLTEIPPRTSKIGLTGFTSNAFPTHLFRTEFQDAWREHVFLETPRSV